MIAKTLVFTFAFLIYVEAKKKCVDGKDNVLRIEEASEGFPVRFYNVRIQTYDAKKAAFCVNGQGALHLPGFIRISSGEVEIPADVDTNLPIRLKLSAEMNSFFVGAICMKGLSQSSFVPDKACSYDFCKLLGTECESMKNVLSKPARLNILELYPQMIPLSPASVPQIDGEWKAEVAFHQNGKILASLRSHTPNLDWTTVVVGNAQSEREFHKQEESKWVASKPKANQEL